MLERACAAVAEGFGFERVGIVRYSPETGTLVPFAGHGLTTSEMAALPAALPIATFEAFALALESGQATFVEHPLDHTIPSDVAERFGIGSFVIVPLLNEGRCLGFMTCDERGDSFELDGSAIDLLTTFGTVIAAFLERAIAHGELRRLNEMKSQFAALASHELRTPVAAIYGVVQTLETRAALLSPEQREQLDEILVKQSQRLFDLVENLLDLSRLEAQAIRIAPAEMPVAARLRDLVGAVSADGFELDVPDDLVAYVDAQAFDRIVSNLLANAFRHGAPPVHVSAQQTNGDLLVTIEDRGPGVAEDFVGSLFERFTRGATPSSNGAGLGLSIAQSYARAHGGTLRYEPAEPTGARFHLVLPAGDA
jgi:two-component system sensor histidine kinase MtrB